MGRKIGGLGGFAQGGGFEQFCIFSKGAVYTVFPDREFMVEISTGQGAIPNGCFYSMNGKARSLWLMPGPMPGGCENTV